MHCGVLNATVPAQGVHCGVLNATVPAQGVCCGVLNAVVTILCSHMECTVVF